MDDLGGKQNGNPRTTVPLIRETTQVYRSTTNSVYIITQCLAAVVVSLGSLVIGFSTFYTAPAFRSLRDTNVTSFTVTDLGLSWVDAVIPIAALAGGVSGGPLITFFGRKITMLATAILFIVSWLLIACAINIGMVIAGRTITGFCIGIASSSFLIYLGETIQPEVRGALCLLPVVFGNIGNLLCNVTGRYMNWSPLAFLGGALAVLFVISLAFIPESPRWLVSKEKQGLARKALQWLRGKRTDVEPELKGIIETHIDAEAYFFKKCNLKPLSILLGVMFFRQFSGINTVSFYTYQIFQYAGISFDDSNNYAIICGVVDLIAILIAIVLIDRLGRKILLYISSLGMIITLGTLGACFYVKHDDIGWLPLASFIVYRLCFKLGFGPIPALMMGEMLPIQIRGSTVSIVAVFQWLLTIIRPGMFGINRASSSYWLFCGINVIGLVFVIFCIPETKRKSLEHIEREMMGRPER